MTAPTDGEVKGRTVAVIGSGISGLSVAWLLKRSGWQVTLYEKEKCIGGHTLTDATVEPPVDLGFQVYNLTTYPNFVGFLEQLGVETEESDMSFGMVTAEFEWASHAIAEALKKPKNLLKPGFLRMLVDAVRFSFTADEVLVDEKYESISLGEYIKIKGYSNDFIHGYLLPMVSAIWSAPNKEIEDFPIRSLVTFWSNHHLLNIFNERPTWRVIKDRSKSYVEKVLQDLDDVRVSCGVKRVRRSGSTGPVTVLDVTGQSQEYDHVIFAAHTPEVLAMLADDSTKEEKELLQSIRYHKSDVYYHSDASLLPKDQTVWASWNSRQAPLSTEASSGPLVGDCEVTYWLNRLQNLAPEIPHRFCTLNPHIPPKKESIIKRFTLEHPILDSKAIRAQEALDSIQGQRCTWFVGAWCGYGFHEDGIKSAVKVAKRFGCEIPWDEELVPVYNMSFWQKACQRIFFSFASSGIVYGVLRLILPNGKEKSFGTPRADFPSVVLRIHHPDFFVRVVEYDDIGMGESYFLKYFDCSDLYGLMLLVTKNAQNLIEKQGKLSIINRLGTLLQRFLHQRRANTLSNSKKNIEEHYDLGNDMYKLFLDESMTYSSGLYKTPEDSLYVAQMNKLDALIDEAGLDSSHNVLEIGFGWGSLALRAVQRTGCEWTGLTLSSEQLKLAQEKADKLGLSHKIMFKLCDYRTMNVKEYYDRVFSCEMIEAVGHEYLDEYFSIINRVLKQGGRVVLQGIIMPDDRYALYCSSSDYIRKYIFPGGHLPCMTAIGEATEGTNLVLSKTVSFGLSYARTLEEWRKNFLQSSRQIRALGYSDQFIRKFEYYFAYCEAGFYCGYIDVKHLVFVKSDSAQWRNEPNKLPRTVFSVGNIFAPTCLALLGMALIHRAQVRGYLVPRLTDFVDVFLIGLGFVSIAYWLAFRGMLATVKQ